MRDPLFDVVFVCALVAINAWLAGSEMAFVSLRQGQLRRMSEEGDRGGRVAELARHPNRYLGGIQLGITLAGFLAAAVAAVSISEPLADALDPLGEFAPLVSVGLVTIGVALLNLVLGELVPKRLAMQRAEGWSRTAVVPLSAFITVTRPVIEGTGWLTDRLVRLLGGDPEQHRSQITDDEFVDLAQSHSTFSDAQQRIIQGAVVAGQRPIRVVMVPRLRVMSVDVTATAPDALDQLVAADFSKAPVVDARLDELVGQVQLRDLVGATGAVADHLRPLLALPETLPVLRALQQLQSHRTEMAAVVDEYGGTAGIVTAEDLVEELVGEISDETDPDLLTVERLADGTMMLPGSFPVHDLPDLGIAAVRGPYDTVAGLVLDRLGHVPEVGERVAVGDRVFEVASMQRHWIDWLRVEPRSPSRRGRGDTLEPEEPPASGENEEVGGSVEERIDRTTH
jgi:putative hemolysin